MGHFKVDASSKPGFILLELHGAINSELLRVMVNAYAAAADALRGAPYRVFCDLSHMLPLSQETTEIFQSAKIANALRQNFEGSAVLVASPLVAMQHRRTSVEAGIIETELISEDVAACWEHLRRVQRSRR